MNNTEKQIEPLPAPSGSACCGHMQFALREGIIRQLDGPYFATDVLPPPLTESIVACPWCGQRVTPNDKMRHRE